MNCIDTYTSTCAHPNIYLGNGRISYPEFLSWYKESDFASLELDDDALQRRNDAAMLFKRYDADGSGSIETEEFRIMHLEMVKDGFTAMDSNSALEDMDIDRDGKIQFNEFVFWLTRQEVLVTEEAHCNAHLTSALLNKVL
jgi:Ca2+-binding EF-hand superfamily protein